MRRYDWAAVAGMRRIYPRPVPLSDEAQAQFDALQGEYDLLIEQEESEAREAELQRLELALDALRGEDVFAAADMAIAGAIVTLSPAGELRIERGFIKPEDDPGATRKPRAAKEGPANTLSAKLVGELTSHQTMSLRDALGENAEAALLAVAHALATALFLPGERLSCLAIRADSRCLDGLVPGIAESPAGQRIAARHEKWAQHLPHDAASLWGF